MAAAWMATKPIRIKAKEKAKGLFQWMVNHWRAIVLISLILAASIFIYRTGRNDGIEEADKAWTAQYNATVAEFNARMAKLRTDSKTVGDTVQDAGNKVTNEVDKIQEGLKDKAKGQNQLTCVDNRATLNTELPPEFFKAWADMNAAGAKHNPYKDVTFKSQTKSISEEQQ